MTATKVGEINGTTSKVFRIGVWVVPILLTILTAIAIPFGRWIVVSASAQDERLTILESFMGEGPRFTSESGALLKADIAADVIAEVRQHEQTPWHSGMDIRVSALERQATMRDEKLRGIDEKLDRLLIAVTELKSKVENGGE